MSEVKKIEWKDITETFYYLYTCPHCQGLEETPDYEMDDEEIIECSQCGGKIQLIHER